MASPVDDLLRELGQRIDTLEAARSDLASEVGRLNRRVDDG